MLQNILTELNSLSLCAFSPLDQFGDDDGDDFITDLTDMLSCPVIIEDLFDLSGFEEVTDLSEFVSVVITNAGTFLFDDEDSSDSSWEDCDSLSSNMQASVFSFNLSGMLPGFDTATSEASLTFFFSFSTIVFLMIVGFSFHRLRYLSILYPAVTPIAMAPFIILIEFVSYVSRAISLGMRLFANMFAGHSLVKILMSFAWVFFNSSLPILSLPVFVVLTAIFLMEVGIAYLQSYVFCSLSGMYLEDLISLEH